MSAGVMGTLKKWDTWWNCSQAKDLVSFLLSNPQGSQQQHLLWKKEIRVRACWEVHAACYDEVSGWEGDQGRWSSGGSGKLKAVFTVFLQTLDLWTSLEVSGQRYAGLCALLQPCSQQLRSRCRWTHSENKSMLMCLYVNVFCKKKDALLDKWSIELHGDHSHNR